MAARRREVLDALFKRIYGELGLLSQRAVYNEARRLVKDVPSFVNIAPPTVAEVRDWLAAKPRCQAKFPVP